ncbi:hypothetical protein Dimus_001151, partial [Dionaea muscipula]
AIEILTEGQQRLGKRIKLIIEGGKRRGDARLSKNSKIISGGSCPFDQQQGRE